MISDCKENFSWCSLNQKVNISIFKREERVETCLAAEPPFTSLAGYNCEEKLYFACEVIILLKLLIDDQLFGN